MDGKWKVSEQICIGRLGVDSFHSGGFMGDLVFNGGAISSTMSKMTLIHLTGRFGMWAGNQQFTVRNVTFNNAQSAIFSHWNWGKIDNSAFSLLPYRDFQDGLSRVFRSTIAG